MYRDVAEAIISSPKWKLALRNCTKTQNGRETTPFRKLIQRMPGIQSNCSYTKLQFILYIFYLKTWLS